MRYGFRVAAAALFALAIAATSAHAVSITVDLDKLDKNTAGDVIEQLKPKPGILAEAKPPVTAEQAKQWADIGKSVGEAIGATAKALSVEVNDFVKTPVGKWAFFLVFWYVIGHKIWAIVGGITIWIALSLVIWKSFRIFHIPKKEVLKDKDGNEQKIQLVKYEFVSSDSRTVSAVVHVIAFVALSIAMAVVILN